MRRFYNYKWTNADHGSAYLPPLQEYVVDGPTKRVDSWRKGRLIAPP